MYKYGNSEYLLAKPPTSTYDVSSYQLWLVVVYNTVPYTFWHRLTSEETGKTT